MGKFTLAAIIQYMFLLHLRVQSSIIYCNRLHGYGLQIFGVVAFLKCVPFRTRLNSHYQIRSQKGKGKKKRKIESLSNGQISKKPVHIGLKIIFIVGQRRVSTGRELQSSRTQNLVLINFYQLTFTKKSQRQNEQYLNTEITHWKAQERSLQNPLSQSVSHPFVLKFTL